MNGQGRNGYREAWLAITVLRDNLPFSNICVKDSAKMAQRNFSHDLYPTFQLPSSLISNRSLLYHNKQVSNLRGLTFSVPCTTRV